MSVAHDIDLRVYVRESDKKVTKIYTTVIICIDSGLPDKMSGERFYFFGQTLCGNFMFA